MAKVRIACKADTFLPFKQIQDFQGELKSRTEDDVQHLIASIERHGFAFPFFVWRKPSGECACIDGHGRIMALTRMEQEGYEIPELPVVYIDAQDENEARTKLIYINTVSGRYTDVGFRDLVKDIPDIDLADYNYPDLDLERIEAEMEILAQAQKNIQTDVNMDWGADVSVDMTAFGNGTVVPPNTDQPVPSQSSVTPGGDSSAPSVVGSAATEYGNADNVDTITVSTDVVEDAEQTVKELVVYCPECGESFILRYEL